MRDRKPKYLTGVDRLVSEMIKRDLTSSTAYDSEIFICGLCQGIGEYCKIKGIPEECGHCKGSGRVKLSFTINRVEL
ncbi:heat shock protein DnaJ [Vibrio phage 1.121.O._10N.286.46.C4]|nr:heat shock protein DnaJ [Vibrio phage 1.121.O._10N.286.46.C4]